MIKILKISSLVQKLVNPDLKKRGSFISSGQEVFFIGLNFY